MARTACPLVADRNRRLVEAFTKDRTLRDEDMSRMFGITTQSVNKILRDAGLISNANRRPRKKSDTIRPYSNLHAAMAGTLDRACLEAILEEDQEPTWSAIGINAIRLTQLRRAQIEFKLSDMEKIAQWMGITVTELVSRAHAATQRVSRSP